MWTIEIVQAQRTVQPPDTVIIRNTEGLGTWQMLRPEAEKLFRSLGRVLMVPSEPCTLDEGKCCCKNCPWNGNHGVELRKVRT